jgi:hypothetical protein
MSELQQEAPRRWWRFTPGHFDLHQAMQGCSTDTAVIP